MRLQRWQPTRLPRPWDSPGKNTGVGCHFLLQCMKVKIESEVAQSCPTLPVPSRLRRPWDFPGKSTGVGCHRPLRRRLVLGSHSAQTPLLLTEILIHLMIGGWGEDTRGDGFAVLTYGEPMGATLLLLHSSFPCPVYFSPCSPYFFFFLQC